MHTEVVYYDVLKDKLIVLFKLSWVGFFDRKTTQDGKVIYHIIYIGKL